MKNNESRLDSVFHTEIFKYALNIVDLYFFFSKVAVYLLVFWQYTR